jgi:hypothetical protein
VKTKGFLLLDCLIGIGVFAIIFPILVHIVMATVRPLTLIQTQISYVESRLFIRSFLRDEFCHGGRIELVTPQLIEFRNEMGEISIYDYFRGRCRIRHGKGSNYLSDIGEISHMRFYFKEGLLSIQLVDSLGTYWLYFAIRGS